MLLTMKRFLKYSILFLALLAILLGCCEVIVRNMPNSYTYKNDWMQENAQRVKTLVLGGSHNYYGVMPSEIGDSVFNLANVSQGHEYDYFLLTKFQKKLISLKNLVIIIDESNIFDPPFEDDDREWFRAIYYKIYYGYPKHSDFSIYNFEISNFSSFNQKFPKAVKYLFTGKTSPDCDSLGWGCTFFAPEKFDTTAMTAAAKKVIERHRCKNWANVDYNVQYLNRIGDWCKHRGVNLIVITTPMWDKFIEMTSHKQIAVMRKVINDFTTAYGAKYKDYLLDPRFQGIDFNDPDHLSDVGAKKFSHILKQDFPEL